MESNPRESPVETKGTDNQERNCLCPLKVCHPSWFLVSMIKKLFCSVRTRCKKDDSSATMVSGCLGTCFGVSGQDLSPRASTCGPPSGTSTRAHVYGTSSSRDLSSASITKSIRKSSVSERVALRKASASAHADFASAELAATCHSAPLCAVLSSAVPTSRRILPPASRPANPQTHTQRMSP